MEKKREVNKADVSWDEKERESPKEDNEVKEKEVEDRDCQMFVNVK